MSAITAKASRKMKKYAVLTREPRCFLGSLDFSWEQRKLSELTSMHARIGWQNLRTSEFLDSGNYMLITGTDFNDGAINFSTCHYVERERYEQDRNIQIHNGSILITKDGTLGKVAYVQGLSMPATLNAGVFNVQIKDANNVDEKYLFQYLKAPFLMDYVDKKATGGTIKHLNQSILVDFPVILPQRSEQTLIGAFFQQLDNLITLHQRKCALLFSPFQALISMMFTTSTFSWEQRKLGDVVKEITRNDPESEAPIMMITANNGFIEQSERYAFNNAGESLKKYILLKKGELAYNHGASKLRPYGSCFALTTAENARIPFVYHCFSAENQNAEFMSIELNGAEIENQLRKIVSSGARMDGLLNISFDEYTSVSVLLPGTEEQDRIADFFRHLDNLITLHQRKCISFTGRAGRLISTVNKKRITSSWEQRKLGDVVKEITRNDPESEAPIMMITANNGFIEQSERYAFNNAGESLKKYILLKKGELAYNHGASKLRPYGSCFALTTAENARIPFVYHCFSAENQNAEFMSIELNGAEIENQLRKIVSSGARMDGLLNISFDEYTSVSVLLPGTEEQDRIADFFRHLDNLITLHQRKPFLMKWRNSDANRNQTNRLVL